MNLDCSLNSLPKGPLCGAVKLESVNGPREAIPEIPGNFCDRRELARQPQEQHKEVQVREYSTE